MVVLFRSYQFHITPGDTMIFGRHYLYQYLITTVLLFLMLAPATISAHNTYTLGKIVLKNGTVIRGKQMIVYEDKIEIVQTIIHKDSRPKLIRTKLSTTYSFNDIASIYTKKGLANRFGLDLTGGLIGLFFWGYLRHELRQNKFSGDGINLPNFRFIAQTGYTAATAGGAAYLIGFVLDPWKIIYQATE